MLRVGESTARSTDRLAPVTKSNGNPRLHERARAAVSLLANLRLHDKRTIAAQTVDITGDARFMEIFDRCRPFTMTSPERAFALHGAVDYLVRNSVPGDFVETGVWRGGSSMIAALTLLANDVRDRDLWLYDTYEGMVEPTEVDRSFDGRSAKSQFDSNPDWCAASFDDVSTNMAATGYPFDRIHMIKGKVEDTIPSAGVPDSIALLRLDTDWYESNKHELENLFPRLVSGGVLLIDDYGHWQGVRRAVDEYFDMQGIKGMLHRIDYTGRMLIKD